MISFLTISSISDRELIEKTLSLFGQIFELSEEDDLDHTAISGSGPAYIFEFTCALEEAARAIGFSYTSRSNWLLARLQELPI